MEKEDSAGGEGVGRQCRVVHVAGTAEKSAGNDGDEEHDVDLEAAAASAANVNTRHRSVNSFGGKNRAF